MILEASRVFEDNWNSTAKLTVNRGGSSSTKTYSLAQKQIIRLLTEQGILISVVRATLPALKKSVYKDFNDILFSMGIRSKFHLNKTDMTFYNPETNSTIEFFSADDEQKARGARRDYLWVNEANEIKYSIYEQLQIRTRKQIDIDFNPSDPNIWINKYIENKLVNITEHNDKLKDGYLTFINPITDKKEYIHARIIKSNYEDNKFLSDQEILEIQSKFPQYDNRGNLISGDPNFWKIFGLGEYGSISGLIFRQPQTISKEAYDKVYIREGFGLDFGYTQDPTALIGCKYDKDNKKLYLNLGFFEKGKDPDEVDDLLRMTIDNTSSQIIADSAEREQIALLEKRGWNILGAKKGPGSVKMGIELLKRIDIFITYDSQEIIKEFGLYKWKEDRNGNSINEPIDMYNHAIDAIRYYISYLDQEQYGKFSGGYGGARK